MDQRALRAAIDQGAAERRVEQAAIDARETESSARLSRAFNAAARVEAVLAVLRDMPGSSFSFQTGTGTADGRYGDEPAAAIKTNIPMNITVSADGNVSAVGPGEVMPNNILSTHVGDADFAEKTLTFVARRAAKSGLVR